MRLRDFLPELPSVIAQSERLGELTNALQLMKSGTTTFQSPSFGIDQIMSQWVRQQAAYRYQMVLDLQAIAMTVEEIRAPIHHITSEVFRRGIEWKPKFACRCARCNIEYNDLVNECEKCGGLNAKSFAEHKDKLPLVTPKGDETPENALKREYLTLYEPDKEQQERLDLFLKDCNTFDQTLEEVLRAFHQDLNICDDGFIHIVKEYMGDDERPGPVRSRVTEIRRLNPALTEFDLDAKGLPKNSHFICYLHRDESPAAQPGICTRCGRGLIPAMYVYTHRGTKRFLLDSEVVHTSKFSSSETYGWSPIMTIFEKALTLIGMDRQLYRYFWERRMPSSMIMVFTDDPESLRRERENIATQLKVDPNYIPMVAVSARNNRGRVDMVRLFHTLQEMDYLPVKNEIRERIAAMWGVTPVWQGAPEAFGGLSMQTSQLSVMSRVVEGDQRIFHEQIFPQILNAFGITDWKLELPQPEEKAEATRIAFAQQKIQAAAMLTQMGFKVKTKSTEASMEDIDFVVSGEAKSPQEMMGGFGGGLGGTPSTGAEGGGEQPTPPVSPFGGETPTAPAQEQPIQFMFKSPKTWISQIIQAGHTAPVIKQVSPLGDLIWFGSGRGDYVARFEGENMVGIEKATFSRPITLERTRRAIEKSKEVEELETDTTFEPSSE